MSSISQIALDLAQLAQNIVRLQEQASAIPERAQVAQVEGANQEDAQQTYLLNLKTVASKVAAKTEVIRLYIEHNAQALQKAADALQNTDGDNSLAARRATAFIDASITSATPPATPGGVAAPQTSGATPKPW
ncbi:hypothetical protein [Microbacterium sp. Clip185]|uniref:hypothetical protein n=1 Tax=Microbacterium sp. Clip185 TaxID=3025663 RepID=UPI0023665D53|nr:hypothetical protein [Microbacterium sp. Clip185]WDG18496.1 hypothetical protein PQV94_01845 [Microbacterium sp. Clip185]